DETAAAADVCADHRRMNRPLSSHFIQRRTVMKKSSVLAMCAGLLLAGHAIDAQRGGQPGGAAPGPVMTMTVAGFQDGGMFPVRFSQAAEGAAPGEGTSPEIKWMNVPAGTQYFVLHMHDMDLARNRTTD